MTMKPSPNAPVYRAARTQEHPWGSITWLAGEPIGNTVGVTLGRVRINAGQSNPRHRHDRCEEVLYLLAGRLVHTMGDERIVLNPGDTLVIPAGVEHQAFNEHSETADMIVAYNNSHRDFVLVEQ